MKGKEQLSGCETKKLFSLGLAQQLTHLENGELRAQGSGFRTRKHLKVIYCKNSGFLKAKYIVARKLERRTARGWCLVDGKA